jgi:prepilin-type N-terminal cleavage/methylation domain-containing protein
MTKQRKGFTLIELLVVMGIIAALAMIGGAAYISAQKRGRNARRAADIQQIRSALEMARTDLGGYPLAGSTCETSRGTSNCVDDPGGSDWDSSSDLVNDLTTEYISTIPKDILNNSSYYFKYKPSLCGAGSCSSYELFYYDEPLTGSSPIERTVTNP